MSRRALVTSDSGDDGGAGVDDGGCGRWLLAMAVGSFVDAAGAVLAAAPPGVDDLWRALLLVMRRWLSMMAGSGSRWRRGLVAGVACW